MQGRFTYAKAIYGGVMAGLGSLATVLVGDVGFGDVTDGQWVAIAVVALGVGGGIAGLKNKE